LQNNEDEIINELLALGILRHKNGQLMVSDNFYMVLDAESFMSKGNSRQKIMHTVYRFAPTVEKQRALTYVNVIEGYLLQN